MIEYSPGCLGIGSSAYHTWGLYPDVWGRDGWSVNVSNGGVHVFLLSFFLKQSGSFVCLH